MNRPNGNYGSDMVGNFGGQFLLIHFIDSFFTEPGSACHWAIGVEFLPPMGDGLVLLKGKNLVTYMINWVTLLF